MNSAAPTPVVIAKIDLEAMGHDLTQLARDRVTAWDGKPWNGHERISNEIGLLGEMAVICYARRMAAPGTEVEWVADLAGHAGDVLVRVPSGRELRVEVKTTTPERGTRLISEQQLHTTSAGVYVWCTTPRGLGITDVNLIGWSLTSEVRRDSTHEPIGGGVRSWTVEYTTEDDGDSDPGYDYDDDDIGYDEDIPRQRRPATYRQHRKVVPVDSEPPSGRAEPEQRTMRVHATIHPMDELLGLLHG